jgi:sporulation protein YlmC with PRC-barrel domain
MFKKSHNHNLAIALVTATSLLAALAAYGEHDKEASQCQCTASDIIGKKVKNSQDEDLGKVQDLIVNLDSGTVPYAIIAHGGILGAGRSKTAVPLSALQSSSDGKSLILSATKEQLQAAAKVPGSAWGSVTNASWARNVDGFYGQPAASTGERYAREGLREDSDRRTFVREPAPKGAELLMTPEDTTLCRRICESTEFVNVRVENGVTYIYGQVDDEQTRRSVESRVRAVPGVTKVESHLRVKNP